MLCGEKEGKEVHAFETPKQFAQWLSKHHASSQGIWLRIYKKDAGHRTVSYSDALDEALCLGWIDGVKKRFDDVSFVQWFCPRRPRSVWSRLNIARVERLTSEGRMKPPGLAQVEAAKADGRWAKAYDAPSQMKVPEDFLARLSEDPAAKAFFETLNRANTYSIAWHLHQAKKPETRERRMQKYLEMMARGEKPHP